MALKMKIVDTYMNSLRYICFLFILLILLTVQAEALPAGKINNSCVDCHRTLYPLTEGQNLFEQIRANHTIRNIQCSTECHKDIIEKKASDNFQQWSDSIHSSYYVTCDDCHGGNPDKASEVDAHSPMKNKIDPESPIYFKNVPVTCGKCHNQELEHFVNTMHYQRFRAESRAPSCVTCHQPHSFKVLKSSELAPLCSLCHNQKDQATTVSVPKDAKSALEKADELKEEIQITKNAIGEAKAKRMEVTSAQNDLEKAEAVLKDIPGLWHSFNLKDFDSQVIKGIDFAKKARNNIGEIEETSPSIPGFGISIVMVTFVILYLVRRH